MKKGLPWKWQTKQCGWNCDSFLGNLHLFFTIKSCLMVSLGWPINRSYGESQLTHQTQTSRAILFGLFGLSARIKKKIAGVCRGFSWWMIFHGGAGKWLHSLPLSDDDDKKNICQCEWIVESFIDVSKYNHQPMFDPKHSFSLYHTKSVHTGSFFCPILTQNSPLSHLKKKIECR